MTSQPDKPKRWRPRFSVRTLVVLVTLVCAYAACWGPTKRDGSYDVARVINPEMSYPVYRPLSWRTSAACPLVVQADDWSGSRRYYFWFFGYVAKLPYARAAAQTPPPALGELEQSVEDVKRAILNRERRTGWWPRPAELD